jgi:hypothetical protein
VRQCIELFAVRLLTSIYFCLLPLTSVDISQPTVRQYVELFAVRLVIKCRWVLRENVDCVLLEYSFNVP